MRVSSFSFIQIPIELLDDTAISPLELRLYCILMRYGMEGRGYSQAGHRFLARKLDVHPKTIAISLNNLQEAGYISITRVGLNRNDKIRCLKTVKREKKEKIRMECAHPIKKEAGAPPPLLENKRTTTNDINRGRKMESKITNEENPKILHIPLKTDEIVAPIPENQAETNEILAEIKKRVRKRSFEGWFDGKIAISYSDSKRIEVNCIGDFEKEWLKDNYKSLIERISGKKVSFVVIYRKEKELV